MRADSKNTVDELLNVAERLFARHGVGNVPLTRIVGFSGQRNRSALHYHFGSRAGLLAAVLDRRLRHINALRHAMLDAAAPTGGRLANTVRAMVTPLCRVVLTEPWGCDYVSILGQVTFHPRALGETIVDDANLSSVRRCKQLVEEALPQMPYEILNLRLRWLTDSVVIAVARWSLSKSKARTREAMDNLIEEIVAYGVAALAAPLVPVATGRPRRAAQVSAAAR